MTPHSSHRRHSIPFSSRCMAGGGATPIFPSLSKSIIPGRLRDGNPIPPTPLHSHTSGSSLAHTGVGGTLIIHTETDLMMALEQATPWKTEGFTWE